MPCVRVRLNYRPSASASPRFRMRAAVRVAKSAGTSSRGSRWGGWERQKRLIGSFYFWRAMRRAERHCEISGGRFSRSASSEPIEFELGHPCAPGVSSKSSRAN